MSEEYIPYFFLAFLILFAMMWFVVTGLLIKKARMSKNLDAEVLKALKKSAWGSGRVNGVSFKNCIRILHTENGYIIETMKMFGGGKLWLAKKNLDIGVIRPQSLFKPKRLVLTSDQHSVTLYSNLADEIV